MLVSKEELRFDFKGMKFDPHNDLDRKFLVWIFNQFLYGEVSGIQCGYWLYRAPHFHAAQFLAKQASEELSHFKRFLRMITLLGGKPSKAHWVVRFLSTKMMGQNWGEHVAMEMALGEGMVLGLFYALIDTIFHPEIRKILESAVIEEQRHVEFGERETLIWIKSHPAFSRQIAVSSALQIWVLKLFRKFILSQLSKGYEDHPVLSQFPAFFDHTLEKMQLRLQRLGVEMSSATKVFLTMFLIFYWVRTRGLSWILSIYSFFGGEPGLLTSTYLKDPVCLKDFKDEFND